MGLDLCVHCASAKIIPGTQYVLAGPPKWSPRFHPQIRASIKYQAGPNASPDMLAHPSQ